MRKVLNFLSTSAMIRMGNVHGCYMTGMECINGKLINRAQHILRVLYNMEEKEAYDALEQNNFVLNRTISSLNSMKP